MEGSAQLQTLQVCARRVLPDKLLRRQAKHSARLVPLDSLQLKHYPAKIVQQADSRAVLHSRNATYAPQDNTLILPQAANAVTA